MTLAATKFPSGPAAGVGVGSARGPAARPDPDRPRRRRSLSPASAQALAMLTLWPVHATPVPRVHVEPRRPDGTLRVLDRPTGQQLVVYTPSFAQQFRAGTAGGDGTSARRPPWAPARRAPASAPPARRSRPWRPAAGVSSRCPPDAECRFASSPSRPENPRSGPFTQTHEEIIMFTQPVSGSSSRQSRPRNRLEPANLEGAVPGAGAPGRQPRSSTRPPRHIGKAGRERRESDAPRRSARPRTPGAEDALAARVRAGDEAAREALVLANLGLAIDLA